MGKFAEWFDPIMGRWLEPYRMLKEPRLVSALLGAAYTIIALFVGLPTLLSPPVTPLALAVGVALSWVIALFTIVGGITAAASLYGGAWFVERFGILLMIGGLLARAATVVQLQIPVVQAAPRVAEIVALCLILAARYRRISGPVLDPTR